MNTQYGKVSEVLRFVQLAVSRSLPSQTKDSLEELVKALSVQLPNVPASQATEGPSPCAPAEGGYYRDHHHNQGYKDQTRTLQSVSSLLGYEGVVPGRQP